MRRRPSPATLIAILALFLSLGGVGIAATGWRITSLSQIKPSVRHQLRGATGPTGPQGIPGPSGPSGQAAPTTLKTIQVDGPQAVPVNGFGNSVAQCPAGDTLLSGGYESPQTTDPTTGIMSASILVDAPMLDQGMQAWGVLASGIHQTGQTVQAFAVCAVGPAAVKAARIASVRAR